MQLEVPGPADYVSVTHSIGSRVSVRPHTVLSKIRATTQTWTDQEEQDMEGMSRSSRDLARVQAPFSGKKLQKGDLLGSNQGQADQRGNKHANAVHMSRRKAEWGVPDPVVYDSGKTGKEVGAVHDSVHADRRMIWALEDAWEQSSRRFAQGAEYMLFM